MPFIIILGIVISVLLIGLTGYMLSSRKAAAREVADDPGSPIASLVSQLDTLQEIGMQPPQRITLVRIPHPTWANREMVSEAIAKLRARGFTEVDAYRIKEMEGLTVFGLVHPQERIAAIVHDHGELGVWTDLYIKTTDGEELTVSNASAGDVIEDHPGARKLFHKTMGEQELLRVLLRERQAGEYVEFSTANFASSIESSYARDAEWREQNSDVTLEKIRDIAQQMGEEFTEEDIERAYEMYHAEAVH